ncbi:Protein of unknown function DUF504 [Sulfolobus islandicus Y.G.57.14]|jgi:Uncharacterized protein conserved in archaea|uniref:UPF0248 protein LS215_2790 n=4 Tax=Saccharolobus islandicus TaxID=43080 RepID=Y2790_SACI2|nr:RNA repair domain-containing protein [Sulfolobus islandicus]C3MMK8.1 RecName: Full=UPF0248 protein LS215_2790 [Sulfolobus islandicus L.S.2.15]C3NBY5.1 RecName: Full=UPF0248 protein YG5714_2801 [Sulfolobus islandicus Y.G.57.14]C3NFE3.1 RecName: Full=UPF0248 protein YN1551_2990 [Sulfolobus islandicus Y.N.15.51]ACP36725.1 Protein of unknown function DUF504 [Sulfolobus islandicus L.S.2.15]ACP47020.1 Protein of unknown function DUF504 [Sulfolobus islandicus Y.G.57.14]ACP49877.1 Protein of unkno
MKIKDAVNMIRWEYREKIDDYVIIIIDRLTENGLKEISFSELDAVDNNYLYLKSEENTVIPLHRVLMIKRKSDNALIWKR